MKNPENIVEFDNVHTYFYTDSGVAKAVNGEKFIVNGKLGSGKTYTALNIIADRLAKNKRILYINQDIDSIISKTEEANNKMNEIIFSSRAR